MTQTYLPTSTYVCFFVYDQFPISKGDLIFVLNMIVLKIRETKWQSKFWNSTVALAIYIS